MSKLREVIVAIVVAALTASVAASIIVGRYAEKVDQQAASVTDHETRIRVLAEAMVRQDERLRAIDDRTKAIGRKLGVQ